MEAKRSEIAGYILAGGKGRRMGGRQKLYLRWQGRYVACWTMDALDMLDVWYLSVAQIPEEPVGEAGWIRDLFPDLGPLGGILSGLLLCPEKALFVVPCDLLGLDGEMAQKMMEEYHRTGRPVFLRTKEGVEPFPGIYTKEMIPVMERQQREGNYRMKRLFETEEAETYSFLDGTMQMKTLINLNTEAEYERLQRRNDDSGEGNGKGGPGTHPESGR